MGKGFTQRPRDRRSDRRPSRLALRCPVRDAAGALGWPRRVQNSEARSGWHKRKSEGKIDPSRGRADALGTRAGGRDEPHAPRGFVDGGGWPRGAVAGGTFRDSGSCNTAGRPRNLSRPLRFTTIAPYRLLFKFLRLTGQSPWSRPRKPKLRWVILFQLGFFLQTERAPLRAQVLGEGRDPVRALTSYGSLYPTFRTAAQARNRLGRRLHRSHLAAMPRL